MSRRYERYLRELYGEEINLTGGGGDGGLSVCIVYPNRYRVAMSNLGFLSVYRVARDTFGVSAERATLPDPEHEAEIQRKGKSILSIESLRPLRQFDALLFSISFENDFINLLKILKLSDISIRSEERGGDSPIVAAGGAAVMINPEALSPFVDFFALGDGEELAEEILTILFDLKMSGGPKDEIMDKVSSIPGVYVPRRFEARYDRKGRVESFKNVAGGSDRVVVRKMDSLSSGKFSSSVVTPNTEFSNMFLVEMGRGCPFSCAFCIADSVYAPVRMRGGGEIIEEIRRGMNLTGKGGLLGPAVSSHPDLLTVLERIRELGGSVGIPSMRGEMLTDDQIGCLKELGVKTITVAPEAGNEGLRKAIGKGIDDDRFFDLVKRSVAAGIFNVRLYFLVGLPGETDDDVSSVAEFAKRVRHIVISTGKSTGRAGRVTVSITPIVPKPHTPLMWMGMEEPGALNGKIKKITKTLKKAGGITVVSEPPNWSYVQALISRGDRRVADIVEGALHKGEDWKGAMRESSINPDFYVLRERDEDEIFPWDFLDYGIDKKALYGRYLKIRSKVK
ncbi:MAG: radical SAM protein [Deltaproteobacteria bacterium]|uniref:Radical SAM protein n=1 Tax=Candidatus Zymogenus saltonus TaxID=2844893 RepID=A0A9D8PNY8_9DELT|nr:radical SAM protein [Candidatus Zymogenus saltonus]